MTKKTHLIEKMTALSHKEKAQIIEFFNKYPNYENRIDWNRKSLQYSDFEKVFALAEKSAAKQKRKAKENPRFLFEKYNCEILHQTDDFLIAVPLDWQCAVFFNSFNCGGEGAKWCIGDRNSPRHWYNYTHDKEIFALVYFTKKQPFFGKKIIFQINPELEMFALWFQNNKGITSQKSINFSFTSYNFLSKYWVFFLPWSLIFFSIAKHYKIMSQVFKIIRNDLPVVANTLLKKIHIPKYIVKESKLLRWYDIEAIEATIPSSITSIEDGAFMFRDNLTKINIPYGVTTIGESAFYYCENLEEITIPDNVLSIGDDAFNSCEKLEKIIISNSVLSIGKGAFHNCKKLKSINIPSSIAIIEDNFVSCCEKLRKIKIPNNVTSIGEKAFACCEELKEINIPDSVTSIGKGAFALCENLMSINLPSNIKYIEREAFWGCSELTTISLPNGLTYIGNKAFAFCESLTTITIPNSVKTIGKKAFEDCINLESVNIPKGIHVPKNVFKGCNKLVIKKY